MKTLSTSPACQVIPAIDILDGTVVRLTQGDFQRVQIYGNDPLTLAQQCKKSGASRLHLVNLSAARSGRNDQRFLELIQSISTMIDVQVGGGIRSLSEIRNALDAGASSVVIGTLLFSDPEAVKDAVTLFGNCRIIAALDTDGTHVKVRGWQDSSGFQIDAALRLIQDIGIRQILVTDIRRDGMQQGPNVDLYQSIRKQCPDLTIIASGGIRNATDMEAISRAGCNAAVVGKALLSGQQSLESLLVTSIPNPFFKVKRENVSPPPPGEGSGVREESLAIRIIPCLDVTGGRVVKGTSFQRLRDAGDPVELAMKYCNDGADELAFLDITATSDDRQTTIDLVSRIADSVTIPFTIGGGVRTVDDARALLKAGADKVTVNSGAIRDPMLLSAMAQELGSANTVCAIDAKRKGNSWTTLIRGGRDDTDIDAIEWAVEAAKRGAGELLVTSFDRDGTGDGFDTDLLSAIRSRVSIPIIASGGGGSLQSFVDAVRIGKADAVLAASVLHFDTFTIREVKQALSSANFPVRPC